MDISVAALILHIFSVLVIFIRYLNDGQHILWSANITMHLRHRVLNYIRNNSHIRSSDFCVLIKYATFVIGAMHTPLIKCLRLLLTRLHNRFNSLIQTTKLCHSSSSYCTGITIRVVLFYVLGCILYSLSGKPTQRLLIHRGQAAVLLQLHLEANQMTRATCADGRWPNEAIRPPA